MTEITSAADLENLTLLGGEAVPGKNLETFPNHHPQRDYTVSLRTNEFTCLCPMTGQPDFAQITIRYIPDKLLLESKSLKLYLASFRNEGGFHEHVTNTLLDDVVKTVAPRWCKVSAEFAVRGGIAITVDGEYHKAPPALPPPVPAEQPEKKRKSAAEEIPGSESRRYESPAPHWDKGRERSFPEGGQRGFSRGKYQAKPEENLAKRRWQQGDERPEKKKFAAPHWEGRPERKKYAAPHWEERPERKNYATPHWEDRPPVETRKSERRTTKSPGQTRTWRKRT